MEPGQIIAKGICLSRPLGQGGMGAVWLADHLALETEVVVKFMHEALGEDASSRERFSREAVAASQVKSPHVVQTFDHGVTPEGVAFIVMEKLDGQDLAHRVEQGVLSPKDTALIMTQTCRALGRAHQVGIVHRDIKPDNIFLCDVGSDEPFVKLLDFGIARSMNPKLDNKTRTGAMMGTPYYMSPEQFAGTKDIDHRTDLWSLGIVAYECLTGKRPFDADTIGGLAIAVHSGNFPVPSLIRPDLAAFDPWFQKACARNMGDRFQSAKEFADAFHQVARGMSHSMPPGQHAVDPLAQSFRNTNPEGIPTVAPALLLSTGSAAAVATSQTGTGAGAPAATQGAEAVPGLPKSGSKGLVFAVAAVVGVLAIGGAAFTMRPHNAPASANSESAPAKAEAPPAPAAPPPPAALTQAAAAQLAPLPNVTAPAASAADTAAAAATHAGAARPVVGATHVAAGAPAAAAPAATHAPAAAAAGKPAVNCNPPFTLDANGVKHPKMECM